METPTDLVDLGDEARLTRHGIWHRHERRILLGDVRFLRDNLSGLVSNQTTGSQLSETENT